MHSDSLHAGNLQLQVPVHTRVTNFEQSLSPHKMMFIEPYAHQIELTISGTHTHEYIMTIDSTQLTNYEEKLWLNE
jgi:hypothetical protein